MTLKDKILSDVKEAMKAKDTLRLETIRFLQSAIKYREIELRPNPMTDQDIMGVVVKMTKQRKDSISEYEKAGRADLADKEKAELKIIEEYLPAQMSKDDVAKIVDDVIKATGATTIKQMGAVMKEVQSKTAGAADGKMISELVKSKLS